MGHGNQTHPADHAAGAAQSGQHAPWWSIAGAIVVNDGDLFFLSQPDTSPIAAGLRRSGCDAAFMRVFNGLIEAAAAFPIYRLPGLLSGFCRAELDTPVRYPVGCHPHAWAAGTAAGDVLRTEGAPRVQVETDNVRAGDGPWEDDGRRDPNLPNNLGQAVPGDPGARGELDRRAADVSPQRWRNTNRGRLAAARVGLLAGAHARLDWRR